MLVVVSYDISTVSPAGRKRLRKVAKTCEAYGMRVQNSVFECRINSIDLIEMRKRLLSLINLEEDSLRLYQIGSKYHAKVGIMG